MKLMKTRIGLIIRDQFEILKSKKFYQFSQNFNKIGIILDYEEDKENVNNIETWPLVQTFSLDGNY